AFGIQQKRQMAGERDSRLACDQRAETILADKTVQQRRIVFPEMRGDIHGTPTSQTQLYHPPTYYGALRYDSNLSVAPACLPSLLAAHSCVKWSSDRNVNTRW